MGEIRRLKKQIRACSQRLDEKRLCYHQTRNLIERKSHHLVMPLACGIVFAFTFSWAYFENFRRDTLKIAKKVYKIGVDNAALFLPLLMNGPTK